MYINFVFIRLHWIFVVIITIVRLGRKTRAENKNQQQKSVERMEIRVLRVQCEKLHMNENERSR